MASLEEKDKACMSLKTPTEESILQTEEEKRKHEKEKEDIEALMENQINGWKNALNATMKEVLGDAK